MAARSALTMLLVLSGLAAAQEQPSLAALAQQAWEANLAAYEAGEVRLLAAYRFSQELYHAEPEPSPARFHERLAALHARAERRAGPTRALDQQTITAIRALVAAQETSEPAARGAAVAAIGSLLATHRELLVAGAGEPDEFSVLSSQLRTLERQQATPAREEGAFELDTDEPGETAWDRAHHERQVWLTDTLRGQDRAGLAEYFELLAAPEEEVRIMRGPGVGEFVAAPNTREEAIAQAAHAAFERAWTAFRSGGPDALAVETWSRRLGDTGGPRTLEGIQAFEREHLARMRALHEVAHARPGDAAARVRLEAALFLARAQQQR